MRIFLSRPSHSHDRTAPHLFNAMFVMNPQKATNAPRRSRGARPPPDPHLVLLLVGVDQGPLAVHLPIVDLAGVQHRACGGNGGRAPPTRGVRCVIPREGFDARRKSEEQDLETRTRAEFDFEDLESASLTINHQPSPSFPLPNGGRAERSTGFLSDGLRGKAGRMATHRFLYIHIIGNEFRNSSCALLRLIKMIHKDCRQVRPPQKSTSEGEKNCQLRRRGGGANPRSKSGGDLPSVVARKNGLFPSLVV